ncbi:hypothetical protein F5613_000637 [Macellibacteroides fermentans]|uniref:RagB/SusD domain-containing protein n=1 Tax=Macellibacteroides fermentans TaxID=879969 RepID=A0A8E2D307_9PORP|nr:RagB/SusD family nutrient uptake outer membrane protein [Macellibacteroides fermentans]NYI48592.1 hypothetical protein [Macellibacteroides fermentans]
MKRKKRIKILKGLHIGKRLIKWSKKREYYKQLAEEIMIHRRVELWGEGFRFTDLKRLNLPLDRTGSNHEAAIAIKLSEPAGSKEWQYMIPQDELNANPLMTQNE